MVLIEKALSIERQNLRRDTVEPRGSIKDHFKPYILKIKNKGIIAVDKVASKLSCLKTDMANLVSLGSESNKFCNQLTVTLNKTTFKQPQLVGEFELETKLYNMEPYIRPERKIELGIELYDIESNWKD